ncbi:hypothetical protein LH460_08850 [Laribacter hongkongensis]|uniref:hypothetical protein n=1 Tax=Laribacter hongkongensis TaxID=168471 RepID=UPI001EFC4919|nr:hypothetical protein [Laribacter hongkongensis]
MKNQKKFNTSLIFLGVVISILVVFIIQLMRHVQSLLELDTKINLTEIVSQNKESITNRLTLNIQSVEVKDKQQQYFHCQCSRDRIQKKQAAHIHHRQEIFQDIHDRQIKHIRPNNFATRRGRYIHHISPHNDKK